MWSGIRIRVNSRLIESRALASQKPHIARFRVRFACQSRESGERRFTGTQTGTERGTQRALGRSGSPVAPHTAIPDRVPAGTGLHRVRSAALPLRYPLENLRTPA